jgi:hypothetical protein
VTENYEIHKFPGWEGNTAGYHIDDGKIFDRGCPKLGKEGDGKLNYIKLFKSIRTIEDISL